MPCYVAWCLFFIINRDIWYDESFTGILVKLDWSVFWQKVINDIHPPLYYFLLKIFTFIFGTKLVVLRSFSLICHLFGIVVFFKVINDFLINRTEKVFLLFIYAINPFLLGYAVEARMYILLNLFVLLITYYFLKYLKINKNNNDNKLNNRYLLLIGMLLGLSWLTHYLSIIFIVSFLLFFLYANYSYLKITFKNIFKRLLIIVLPFSICFFVWLPFL